MHFHRLHNERGFAGRSIAGALWNSFNSTPGTEASIDWRTFLDLWERAGRIRALLASPKFADPNALLSEFLAGLRQLFAVDFCFGYLLINSNQSAEIGLPETTVGRLPSNFSRHCLALVANSRTPVVWNEASAEFGFRSTVVAPVTPSTGRSIGFLMLGNLRRKSYSPAELFVLQALATEAARAARDLAAVNDHREKFAALCHQVRNSLQVIIGNTTLLALKLDGGRRKAEKHLSGIETSAQQILDGINGLAAESQCDAVDFEPAAETVVDIAETVNQAIAASRRIAEERGVAFEVVHGLEAPSNVMLDRAMFIGMLDALVTYAAIATRNEAVRVSVRRCREALEVAVQGLKSNRVAEKLQALLQSAVTRSEEIGIAPTQVGKYLASVGGDVYLKSRAGETAEFVVALPLDRGAQLGRLLMEKMSLAHGI